MDVGPILFSASVNVDDFIATSDITGWDLAFAGVSLVAAWVVGRFANRGTLRLLSRVDGLSEPLRLFFARLAKYLVWLLGIGVALSFVGAQVQPFLTAALLVVVIVGIGLRGIAENFAAGLVIQTRRPIEIGDTVEMLGFAGEVTDTNASSVVLRTIDGRQVHVPNREVLENPIVNTTATGVVWGEAEVRAASSHHLDSVVETVSGALGTFTSPHGDAPQVLVTAVEPERYILRVRVGHDPRDGAATMSSVVSAISAELSDQGVTATVVAPVPARPQTAPSSI